MKNGENQTPLTKEELKDCEEFKQTRVSCHMTQDQWAKAIGISYPLVKRIESHTIKCSNKTKIKVQTYFQKFDSNHAVPDLHGLEAHVLYDVILSHMEQIPKKDSSMLAARCTRNLQHIFGHASEFDSTDTQKTYFQYLEELLTMLSLVTADAVANIKQGKDVLNISHNLKNVFSGKQSKNSPDTIVSKDKEVCHQISLFDFGL